MATNYTVKPNQSMPDVIIQATGSLEAGMQFCNDNNVAISDTPAVGALMVVSDAALALGGSDTLQYINQNGVVLGTLNAIYIAPLAITYYRSLTISHTKCGSSDSSNFPVLVSISGASLKTAANGGHVNNSNGYDIQFFSDLGLTTKLNWEVEYYNAVTGALTAWVQVPVVSHSSDTVFYMQYGDTSISTFQGGATGSAWDSNFMMVQHLPDGTTLSANDATANGNNGVISGATASAGIVNGGASFGTTAYINVPASATLRSTTATWSGWIKTTVNNASYTGIWIEGDSGAFGNDGVTVTVTSGKILVVIKAGHTAEDDIVGATFVSNGNWHYISILLNGSGVCTLYVDGAVDSVVTISNAAGWAFAPNPFRFGTALDTFWPSFVGYQDEVRISNINRSGDWILTEYNNMDNPGTFLAMGSEVVV